MTVVLAILALLSADNRPEWWRAPSMGLDASWISYAEEPGGGMVLDPPSATALAGILERCRAYPPILDRQLGALYDLHLASVSAARASGDLDGERRAVVLSAESSEHWPTWQVAILAIGIGAAGLLVGVLAADLMQPAIVGGQ